MINMIQLRRWLPWLLLCALSVGLATPGCRYWAGPLPLGADNNTRVESNAASSQWAQPMEMPGLPNLYRVSEDLYRGAEPTSEGMQQLKKLGVKTVIDLRDSGTLDELQGTGMTYVRIPSSAWQPEDQDVEQFLRIVTDKDRTPVFVHCKRGADRTGMMSAIYRVAVQGWTKDQAIAEMTQGGFRFYSGWRNIVRYIRDLDIERIKPPAVTSAVSASTID
jgi:protein tyrosine phosphatase (PTP) superfamily phosphohydrolase (DUF442 family)